MLWGLGGASPVLPDLAGEGGLSTFPTMLGTMAEPSRLVPVGPPGPAGSEPGIRVGEICRHNFGNNRSA